MMKNNKKLITIVAIVLLIGLLFFMISETVKKYQYLKGEIDVYKELYEKQKSLVDSLDANRLKQKDSLLIIIDKKVSEIENLEKDNKSLEERISDIKKKPIIIAETTENLVAYFNQRYETNENKVLENNVALTNTTASKVNYELEEKDHQEDIMILKDEQLVVKNTIIDNLKYNNFALNTIVDSAEKEIEERKKLEEISSKNIENLNGQVKQLRKRSTLQKILIPVGIVAGGFLGYQIAK